MTAAGRSARIQVLVAQQAARRGDRVGVLDVCAAAVAALPVAGAGVSAMSRSSVSHPLCGTDEVSQRLEELQLTLGEGPCVDAFALGAAVLTPDLATGAAHRRWPVFAAAASEAGAAALFAFPLQLGAVSPGVLDLYSDVPVRLGAEELADAMAFADTATLVLLDSRISDPDAAPPGGAPERPEAYRAEIDQAAGMLTEQLGVGIEEALIRLRGHAYAHGRRLAEVAGDVVARRLRLGPDADQEQTGDQT